MSGPKAKLVRRPWVIGCLLASTRKGSTPEGPPGRSDLGFVVLGDLWKPFLAASLSALAFVRASSARSLTRNCTPSSEPCTAGFQDGRASTTPAAAEAVALGRGRGIGCYRHRPLFAELYAGAVAQRRCTATRATRSAGQAGGALALVVSTRLFVFALPPSSVSSLTSRITS